MDESVQKHLEQPTLDSASKLLLRAADLLEEHGWIQGRMLDEFGRMCMLGALHKAANYSRRSMNAAHVRLHDNLGRSVPAWNDRPRRTQTEVVAKLRTVALISPRKVR